MNKTLLGIVISSLFAAGCSFQPAKTETTAPLALDPVQYQPGEFNRESLLQLLQAEIAGQRRQFDVALEIYLQQARLTRDPGVAERATRIAQYLQRPDDMLQAAELWIEAQPDNPEPYQLAAGLLLHEGDYEAALPLMERALAEDSRQALALLVGQAGNISPRQLDGYIAMLDRQLEKAPGDSYLLLTRGQLLKQLDRTDEALADFDQVLRQNPDDLDALMLKAELLRLSDRPGEALQLLRPYLKSQSENRQIRVLQVQLLFQDQQQSQASDAARRLIRDFPDDNQLHYYLALLMLENDQLSQSRIALEQLLEQSPDNSEPHFYLGYIAQTQGRNEEAIEHYSRVSDGSNLFQSYARTLNLLDTPADQARIELILENARARYPELAPRFYGLQAEWLNQHASRDAALAILDQGLAELGNEVTLLYSRAMLIDPDNFPQIEQDLRKVLEMEPDNASALNALGYTLTLYTDRYDEAYRLIEQALQQKPDDPAVLDSMGWVLFKLQRFAEAIDYLQRAYDNFPDPEVTGHLIRAYWADGRQNRARELLEQHLGEDPQNEHLREAARALGVN
ncbi:tetratricopeptide repeat protein [Marinobacterium rhizophilum]|uniref:Tetratricopeptide repeat protein n=1 Tax=Marinobacterium rhizophilum TaxID=420402 RepID=A0ABY5HIP6_9GAMM|nr:tetratricopeptide repeat protein [Marinobacterium rhizophilum]UTW11478.1 tetratricopeptide repeat protein [Marinobacterium rhizophilum]